MEINEALHLLEDYNLWLVVIGLGILTTTVVPRLWADYPLSMPMLLVTLGYAAVALLKVEVPHPQDEGTITEHLTELGVIIALMGAGLSIDRPPSLKTWSSTWRLLGITMILSIAFAGLIGWWVVAFAPATAALLGAAIAPTDPVLASEVQVGAPGEGADHQMDDQQGPGQHKEDELRFSLTSEAGLNDGLAFPFTNMAIAMAMAGAHPANWIDTWLLIHLLYEIGIAVVMGLGMGWLLARLLFSIPAKSELGKAMIGLGALAATLLIYGATEAAGGYGFIATFIGAVTIRNHHRDHDFHHPMHILTEKLERILTALILIGFGGAIANGLFAPLNWKIVVAAILILFLVRPLAGIIGMVGHGRVKWRERLAISYLGIRGIGSLYYLSYALNQEHFEQADELWALVGLVVVLSIFVHGITATPITQKLDKLRQAK